MSKVRMIRRKTVSGIKILRKDGVIELSIRALQKLQKFFQRNSSHKLKMKMLSKETDILAAEWTSGATKEQKGPNEVKTITWVMSPPGVSGGGHQNIFRFIKFLDDRGYRNFIYLYSVSDFPTITEVKERLTGTYDLDINNMAWLNDGDDISVGDALFATGWETAYPVYNAKLAVRKFYFVQDFEPLFYPMGSEYIIAENTYKLGLTGITAGNWLATKLSTDYGMKCYPYNFGAEATHYKYTNTTKRQEIFFYARPITTRRGFELGIMALHKFHQKHPEYVINLAGWDVSDFEIPFPYINHKAMQINQLSDLYNRCAAALVISLTNMSLLPLELLAAGTIPVVNDGPNNRLVSDNPFIKYAIASPDGLADALAEIISRSDSEVYAAKAAKSVESSGWDEAGRTFIAAVEKELYG